MITAKFDFSRINKKLDGITQAAEKAVRPAAQAGAQVFYEELLARVPVSEKARRYKGKTIQPGTLYRAVYQAYMNQISGDAKASYRISWNKRKAPHGRLVEFGTSRMAAQPFLRPSYDSGRDRAINAVRERMYADVKKALT